MKNVNLADIDFRTSFLNQNTLEESQFQQIRELIQHNYGIFIAENRKAFVESRLTRIFQQYGFESFPDYLHKIKQDCSGELLQDLIDKLTTNHTYFFREPAHFDYLRLNILPELTTRLRKSGDRDLRIWSAGTSSGEEAYSIQMVLMDYLSSEYPLWKAGLLATDISTWCLDKARRGIYESERIMKIPAELRRRFLKPADDSSSFYQIIPEVISEIAFRLFNLNEPSYPFAKPFQIIFCRNVLMYFDQKTQQELIKKLHRFIEPGGYLFTGHSESIRYITSQFELVVPAVYRRL